MTLTTPTGTHNFTEPELERLALRFHVDGDLTGRRFYLDGVEVSEAEYVREFEAETGLNASRVEC